MYCKKCGTQINDRMAFCPLCGTKVGDEARSLVRTHAQQVQPLPAVSAESVATTPVTGAPTASTSPVPNPLAPPAKQPPAAQTAWRKSPPYGSGSLVAPMLPQFFGPSCSAHAHSPAIATCSRCGKHVCKECEDTYISMTGRVRMVLCGSCATEAAARNIELAQLIRTSIADEYHSLLAASIVGAVVGLLIGMALGKAIYILFYVLYVAFAGAAIQSVVADVKRVNAVSAQVRQFAGADDDSNQPEAGFQVISFLIACTIAPISLVMSLVKLYNQSRQLGPIEERQKEAKAVLVQYQALTTALDRYAGKDVSGLLQPGAELANNEFAAVYANQGLQAARMKARTSVEQVYTDQKTLEGFAK